MAHGSPDHDWAAFAEESLRLLKSRARVGLWILVTFALLFTAADWLFNPGNFTRVQLLQIALLRAAQLLGIAVALPALARQKSWRDAVALCVGFVVLFNASIVVAGVATGDLALAPIVLMGTSMFSAAFVPWGLAAQMVVALLAMVGIIVNAALLQASLTTVVGYNALEAYAVLAASVWVAGSLEAQRRALYAAERAREAAVVSQLRAAQIADALARVGREMIEVADAPDLVQRMCAVAATVLGCQTVRAFLRDDEGDGYVPVAAYGDRPEEWEMIRLLRFSPEHVTALARGLDRAGLVETRSETAHDVVGDPLATMMERTGITRSLFMALHQGDTLLGTLQAADHGPLEPFAPAQRRIASGIAHLASMTIEHARVRVELERANQVKAHFVASLSHELRNSITVIQGYHQLLLADADDLTGEQTDMLRRADKCAGELDALITATLDLSRFEAKRVPIDVQAVPLRDLVDELRREFSVRDVSPAVHLEWQLDDRRTLRTDPLKLKMILRNLVTNALKFTDQGTITIAVTARAEGAEFRICDTGIGIAADKIATIFEPFTQAHGLQSRRKGGAGLGLHLVRRLVEVLGGDIDVDSTVGRGSTFRVLIPDAGAARDEASTAAA